MVEEKQKPLSRKDLEELIKEKGTTRGLDLSGKTFEDGIDLRGLDLTGIILKDAKFPVDFTVAEAVGARFDGSCLQGAVLSGASLDYASFNSFDSKVTNLDDAHLEGTRLWGAHLEGAQLLESYLEGAWLWSVMFSPHMLQLESIHWGNYIIGEENNKHFNLAADTYRRLKIWYTSAGMYDVAGEFLFREMEAKKKLLKWQLWPLPLRQIRHVIYGLLCGYGERPWRVVASAAITLFGLAFVYFLIGSTWDWSALGKSIYFSAVSFVAVGYGSWVSEMDYNY